MLGSVCSCFLVDLDIGDECCFGGGIGVQQTTKKRYLESPRAIGSLWIWPVHLKKPNNGGSKIASKQEDEKKRERMNCISSMSDVPDLRLVSGDQSHMIAIG